MTFSDPMKSLAIQEPVQEIDNLEDIDYQNIKKAALVLTSLNHNLRQQVIKTIHENKRLAIKNLNS
jgi:hypothetical protein